MKRYRNGILLTLSAALLAACGGGPDLPPLAYSPPTAPTPEKAIAGARQAAKEEKLTGLIEVSAAREGNSLGPGQYLLCLRGSTSPSEPRHTYAVFFNNEDYKDVRLSVILDECEKQTFNPLPADQSSDDDTKPKSGHRDRAALVGSR